MIENPPAPLPPPTLTSPPNCACRGLPQMREHTRLHCSVLKTEEVNELMQALNEDKDDVLR